MSKNKLICHITDLMNGKIFRSGAIHFLLICAKSRLILIHANLSELMHAGKCELMLAGEYAISKVILHIYGKSFF